MLVQKLIKQRGGIMISSKGYFYSNHHQPKSKKAIYSTPLSHNPSANITGISGVSYSKLKQTLDTDQSFWKNHTKKYKPNPIKRLQLILNNTCSNHERNSFHKRVKSSLNQNYSFTGFQRKNTVCMKNSKTMSLPKRVQKNMGLKRCLFRKESSVVQRPSTTTKQKLRYSESQQLGGSQQFNFVNNKYFIPSSKFLNNRHNKSTKESRYETSYNSENK